MIASVSFEQSEKDIEEAMAIAFRSSERHVRHLCECHQSMGEILMISVAANGAWCYLHNDPDKAMEEQIGVVGEMLSVAKRIEDPIVNGMNKQRLTDSSPYWFADIMHHTRLYGVRHALDLRESIIDAGGEDVTGIMSRTLAMETAYVLLLIGEPDRAFVVFVDAMGPMLTDIRLEPRIELSKVGASMGLARPELDLGIILAHGDHVQADPEEAYRLIRSSSEKGCVMAGKVLSRFLEEGILVEPQDSRPSCNQENAHD